MAPDPFSGARLFIPLAWSETLEIRNTEPQRTQRMKDQNSVLSVTLCFK